MRAEEKNQFVSRRNTIFFLESHNENVIYFVNIEALGSDAINHASHYKN